MKEVTLEYKGRKITVKVLLEKRKTIKLQIEATGEAKLKMPKFMTSRQRATFLEENYEALCRHYREGIERLERNGKVRPIEYKDIYYNGAVLPLEGEKLNLVIVPLEDNKREAIKYSVKECRQLEVYTKDINPAYIREKVVGWYKMHAKVELARHTKAWSEKLGVTFNRMTIKEQKTRWGSCSSLGNLNFNWKIVLMPRKVQDYIIVHELCHLIEMNHSKAFWRQVEKILPEYKEQVVWLKKNGIDYFKY